MTTAEDARIGRDRLELRAAEFLPGRLWIERGTVRDYRALARFHYAPGDPATWAGVWRCLYAWKDQWRYENCKLRIDNCQLPIDGERVVGVAVLSFPTLLSRARVGALRLRGRQRGAVFVNRHVRTISRVIVHPQFRSLGIASALVRRICCDCTTRYVEAMAAMGRVHPFFERGGMKRIGEGYFLFDRKVVNG